jgi:type III secretion system HrpB7-like protein
VTAKSRIVALNRSITRRHRLDEQLREQLTARRSEQTDLNTKCEAQLARVETEQATLRSYVQKIDIMTNGTQTFSLNDFNDYRLCIEIAKERADAESARLTELESALSTVTDAIAHTRREIAQNNARVEKCRERVTAIQRELDIAAENTIDEEAEELAAARVARTRTLR